MAAIGTAANLEEACSASDNSKRPRLSTEYMSCARQRLLKEGAGSTTFVCGNEAGDLDTIVSALAVAYGLEQAAEGGKPAVALCPFSRREFRLRGDAQQLFLDAGFTLDKAGAPPALLFWDEADWATIRETGAVLALTDHNKASDALSQVFGGRVELIIDHHADSKAHLTARRVLDDSAGSCCTLVAEWLEDNAVHLPPDLGALLLGTILVDTRNFSPEDKRFNARDERAFTRLRSYLPASVLDSGGGVPDEAMSKWYQKLHGARYDVSNLSVNDLLRLDYKEVEAGGLRLGFASVFDTVDGAVTRAGDTLALQAELRAFAEEKRLDVLHALMKRGEHPPHGDVKSLIILENGGGALGTGAAIRSFLEAVPDGLPEELRAMPLFVTQGIIENGFGIRARADLSPLCVMSQNKEITRKTLMPAVVSFLQAASAVGANPSAVGAGPGDANAITSGSSCCL